MSSELSQIGANLLDTDLAMSQIGDAQAMQDMLVMLQDALANDVPKVSSLIQAGDVSAANHLLHTLKGFIPIFCRDALCHAVVRVEGLSKAPASPDLAIAYAALRPYLEQLHAEVSAYLADAGKGG